MAVLMCEDKRFRRGMSIRRNALWESIRRMVYICDKLRLSWNSSTAVGHIKGDSVHSKVCIGRWSRVSVGSRTEKYHSFNYN